MIAAPWLPVLRKAARSYVAGPELGDALRPAHAFAVRGGPASTLCFWDAYDDCPEHVTAMYSATVQAIQSAHLDSYVSIKAPSPRPTSMAARGSLEIAGAAHAAARLLKAPMA